MSASLPAVNRPNPARRFGFFLLAAVLIGFWLDASSQAAPTPPDEITTGTSTAPEVSGREIERAPVASSPADSSRSLRFSGWFQPWVAWLMLGVPVAWALAERRRDIVQFFRAQAWKRRVDSNGPPGR